MPRFHPSARFLNYRRTYFPNFAETIRNEEQFKISVTVPYLESLSYQRADIEFERRIDVQIGTRTHSVQADIVINIEGCPFVVIDTKTPSERVTETDVLQALSYAKLISTPPAAVGIAINGYECSGVNVITGARLNDVPTRDEPSELFRLHRPRPLSEIVLQETKRILNTIDNREELYRVIRECKILIERQGGIRNDISFREMTKLLLVKMAEERRAQFELTNRFSDTYLTQFAGANDISYSAAMERLFSEVTAQYPNIYSTGERLRISDDTVMSGIVRRLENFSFTGTGDDIKGAVYEIFLKSQLRGELDQYFTPREIVEFMTSLADPNIGERVLDAACGSGGFLIHAFRHVKQKIDDSNAPDHTKQEQNDDLIAERLWGVEIDEDLHTLAKINLIMHGDGYNHIIRGDGLSTEYLPEDFFDVVLMNPPFTTPSLSS
jgi:type I restriction enzyme M protein